MSNRSILFVIVLGRLFPSGVRRAMDYLPYLHGRHWHSKVVSYKSPLLYRGRMYNSRITKKAVQLWRKKSTLTWAALPFFLVLALITTIVRLVIRLASWAYTASVLFYLLVRAKYFDVIFFVKVTPPVWFVNIICKLNSNIVYDIDDAVFLKQPARTTAIVSAAAVATPGSHYNAEFCHQHCNNVVFLPTPVPWASFQAASKEFQKQVNSHFRVGWVGSAQTARYLDVIVEPLRKLGTKYPGRISLVIVGLNHRKDTCLSIDGVEVEVITWVPPDHIPSIVASLDIGIMPLYETDWEKGKCGMKALEYMAAGKPAVCSAVGENNFIIQDGINGFLAKTEADWQIQIERLMMDPGLRERIGKAGQDTIRHRYSTEVCFDILLHQVLEPLVAQEN